MGRGRFAKRARCSNYANASLWLLANWTRRFEGFLGWRSANLVTAFAAGVIFSIWLVALANNLATFTGEDLFVRDNLRTRRKFRYGDASVAAQFNIGVFLPSGKACFQRRHVERKSITRQEISERQCSDAVEDLA